MSELQERHLYLGEGSLYYYQNGALYDATTLQRTPMRTGLVEVLNFGDFTSHPVLVQTLTGWTIFVTDSDDIYIKTGDSPFNNVVPVTAVIPFQIPLFDQPGQPERLTPAALPPFHPVWLARLQELQRRGGNLSELDRSPVGPTVPITILTQQRQRVPDATPTTMGATGPGWIGIQLRQRVPEATSTEIDRAVEVYRSGDNFEFTEAVLRNLVNQRATESESERPQSTATSILLSGRVPGATAEEIAIAQADLYRRNDLEGATRLLRNLVNQRDRPPALRGIPPETLLGSDEIDRLYQEYRTDPSRFDLTPGVDRE